MRPEGTAPLTCHILVRGCIGERWGAWLDEMAIRPAETTGETILAGAIIDQAALLGLLQKLHNIGLALLEVRIERRAPAETGPDVQGEEQPHERGQADRAG